MYYHVLVETCEKDKNGNFAQIASTDLTDIVEILSDYIIPYVRKTTFMLNGYVVNPSSVRRLLVKSSNIAAKNLADQAAKRGAVLLGANAICNYIFNHTDEATEGNGDTDELSELFSKDTFKEDYRILNSEIRKLGYNIPPLVNAYMSLSPTMRMFGTAINYGFGDVEETGILIAVDEILEEKRMRHIESFVKNDPHDCRITSGANKVFYKRRED